jgi:hypothetical protein
MDLLYRCCKLWNTKLFSAHALELVKMHIVLLWLAISILSNQLYRQKIMDRTEQRHLKLKANSLKFNEIPLVLNVQITAVHSTIRQLKEGALSRKNILLAKHTFLL